MPSLNTLHKLQTKYQNPASLFCRLYGPGLNEIVEKLLNHMEGILLSYTVDQSYPLRIMQLKKELREWTAKGQVKLPVDFCEELQKWYQDIFADQQMIIKKLEFNYRDYVGAKFKVLTDISVTRSKRVDPPLNSDQQLIHYLSLKKARKNLSVDYFVNFTPELLLLMFLHLDVKSLTRLEQVHSVIRRLILGSNLWQKALVKEIAQDSTFKKDFSNLFPDAKQKPDAKNSYKLTFSLGKKNRKLHYEQHAAMCRQLQSDFFSAQCSRAIRIEETNELTSKIP